MSCDMSYCPRETIYTSKTGSKYCVKHQIAFNCEGCDKPIVRDSEEHDNCICDDEGEKWYCEDCGLPDEEEMCCYYCEYSITKKEFVVSGKGKGRIMWSSGKNIEDGQYVCEGCYVGEEYDDDSDSDEDDDDDIEEQLVYKGRAFE